MEEGSTDEMDTTTGSTSGGENPWPNLDQLFIFKRTSGNSSAGLLYTAKRARLSAENFENQLLLKMNKKLCEVLDYGYVIDGLRIFVCS